MIGALANCIEGSDAIAGMPAESVERADEVLGASADWQRAHTELCSLARSRAGLDFDEGRWLVLALRGGAHGRLGYGSFAEYVERLFGYSPRLTHDKLRVAEALAGLPVLARALRAGEASWSALRELTRVAVPTTERQWLEAARGRTVREVEQLVSGHRPGSQPGDARDRAALRHVLRFEVSGEALATFREAMSKIRRDAGQPLDDDAAILLLARQVLVGPGDAARASYQVALTVCEACQHAQQHGRGELIDRAGSSLMRVASGSTGSARRIIHVAFGELFDEGRPGSVSPPGGVVVTVFLRLAAPARPRWCPDLCHLDAGKGQHSRQRVRLWHGSCGGGRQ